MERTLERIPPKAADLSEWYQAVCYQAELVSQAKRPILLAGGGVLRENALAALEALAEATGIPVATLQFHPDAFPTSHALALGPLGRNGWSSANRT